MEKSAAGSSFIFANESYLLISATYRAIADKPVSFAYNVIRAGKEAAEMKVRIQISDEYMDPEAEIRASRMTEAVEAAVDFLQSPNRVLTVYSEDRMVVLKAAEIYVAKVENERTILYTKGHSYISGKRLYELQKLLGNKFMRISKSVLVNLNYLDHVEAEFGGMMLLTMKNGSREYVSRHYLPEFRKYLGL